MIHLDLAQESDGRLLAKISADGWELNVRASADEFVALDGIGSADWESRGSIRAGIAAGCPVYLSCSSEVVSILIGEDDETWDIAMAVPLEVAQRLAREAVEFGFGRT